MRLQIPAIVERDRKGRRARFDAFLKPDRVLFVTVLVAVLVVILRCLPLVAVPYQIDYGEGLMLEGARCLRDAQPLYPNPFSIPIVLHVYGPVAYAATALVLPGGVASFPAGRRLIVILSFSVALLLGAILRRLTGSGWIGFSFGLLLVTLPAFRFWLYLLRADVIGVVFSGVGIALYVFKDKNWYWSVPFFGLAVFCKYTLLAAPVAVFLHLVLNRKVMRGIGFAAVLGFTCSLAFAILQVTTHGWFAFHMFSTHPDRYSGTQFLLLAALVTASAPVVTALAVWYVVRDLGGRGRSFPSVYFVVSFVAALTAGKLGSTTNHFVEWMMASCLCAGLGYSVLMSKQSKRVIPVTALLGASVLAGVIVQDRQNVRLAANLANCGEAYRYVAGSSAARILSENLGPPLVAGKPILVSDPFVFGQLLGHGRWPSGQVESLFNERYFDLIVLTDDPSQMKVHGSDVWPPSLVEAMGRNYRTVDRFGCRDAGVMLVPAWPGDQQERPPGTSP